MKNKIERFIALYKIRSLRAVLDLLLVWVSLAVSAFIAGEALPSMPYLFTAFLVWFFFANWFLLYSVSGSSFKHLGFTIFNTWLVLTVLTFYLGEAAVKNRILFFLLPAMLAVIYGVRFLTSSFFVKGDLAREDNTAILGATKEADEIRKHLKEKNFLGFITHGEKDGVYVSEKDVLGDAQQLYRLIVSKNIDEIVIALPEYTPKLHKRIENILTEHAETGVKFRVASYLHPKLLGRFNLTESSGELLMLDITGHGDMKKYLHHKRLLDILISFSAVLVFSPVIFLVCFAQKIFNPGPVLYKQRRMGQDGKSFLLYKFRTMVPDAEKHTGPVWTEENDERITSLGRILRKSSLDELPQLMNVLKGDMSLVGPRPEREHFVKLYKELSGKRLNMRPGLTGLAQVNGRYDLNARHKSKYDYVYLKNCSLGLDLLILFRTVRIVFTRKGAR